MYCINCGTQLSDGIKFCFKCGQAAGEVQSSASTYTSNANTVPTLAGLSEIKPSKLSYAGICASMAILFYLITFNGIGVFMFWTFLSRLIAPGVIAYLAFSIGKVYPKLFFIPLCIKGFVGLVLLFSSSNSTLSFLSNLIAIAVAMFFVLTVIGKITDRLPLFVLVGVAIIIAGWSGFRSGVLYGFMQILYYIAVLLVIPNQTESA